LKEKAEEYTEKGRQIATVEWRREWYKKTTNTVNARD